MKLDELLEYIKWENERLNRCYPDLQKDAMAYARTVKINEEVGELCNEVLMHYDTQRSDKLASKKQDALSEEFADVIITTLLLAEYMGVDIKKALEKKTDKIKNRKYKGER